MKLGPGECRFCKRRVLWLPLLSGIPRSFEPQEFDLVDIGEPSAWVAKKTAAGLRAVPVSGEKHPPSKVLAQHLCTQYQEAKLDERLAVGTSGETAVDDLQAAWSERQ